MSFTFDSEKCATCKYDHCHEDRRQSPATARQPAFLLKEQVALACTFDEFVPGSDKDPHPNREYFVYLQQFKTNLLNAGRYLFGEEFDLNPNAMARLEDDIFEALEAATLWNAAATWNIFMETGEWSSQTLTVPESVVPRGDRKLAIIRLPQDFDMKLLFDDATRAAIGNFQHSLDNRDLELKLSCPDLVGIRLPTSMAKKTETFSNKIESFTAESIKLLENAYKLLEGTVSGPDLLFAISVKKSVINHQLYLPLYEANVLKYLVQEILHGTAFRYYVHIGSTEGANAGGRYHSASLYSLMRGNTPQRAIDRLHTSLSPLATAQVVLEDFPKLPI
jgi:hypothetical protein